MTATTQQQPADYDHLWTNTYSDLHRYGPTCFHAQRIARRLLAELDYRTVLDVGCGTGRNIDLLSVGRVLDSFAGVDISEEAVRQARLLVPKGEFHVLDIQTSALPGKWDLVHCALMIHMVPDDLATLRNLHKNTGKYLLISTMTGNYERYQVWEETMGALRNYRRGELEDKLTQVGYRIKRAVYWGWPFYSPLARWLQTFSGTGRGSYGLGTRLIAQALKLLYYLNSSKRGDVLTVVAEV